MRQAAVVTGLLLTTVVMAGCTGMPFGDPTPQEEPAPVKLVNNATLTETFTVGVVDEGANLTIQLDDGRTGNYTVGPGSSTYTSPNSPNITQVNFPDSARIIGRYTLEPGESKLLSIENVAPDQAIVVLVYDEEDGTYRSIKSLSCGQAILGYKISPESGGPEDWTPSAHQCG